MKKYAWLFIEKDGSVSLSDRNNHTVEQVKGDYALRFEPYQYQPIVLASSKLLNSAHNYWMDALVRYFERDLKNER